MRYRWALRRPRAEKVERWLSIIFVFVVPEVVTGECVDRGRSCFMCMVFVVEIIYLDIFIGGYLVSMCAFCGWSVNSGLLGSCRAWWLVRVFNRMSVHEVCFGGVGGW